MQHPLPFGTPAAGAAPVQGSNGTVVSEAKVYALGIQTGNRYETIADTNGAFNLSLPTDNLGSAYYALYYSTPRNLSNRYKQ